MKGKVAFVAGAGLGYLLGTRAGRGQFDKLQAWAGDMWKDPRVQGYVQDFEVQARQFARDQGAVLKDRAVDAAWSAMGQTTKTPADPDEIVVEDELDPNARRF
ncbi:YtxH domain-containing protein [Cellulomonas rhizosphaerae]|uniref:YtxH domain-containing protein n=1 Tax=Cellulomonas rhizosphaerae TaxID=2293719 RepID=A0A413RGX7_9CELL|nr:YtxH domain-containing protein [Cellulomonas rhizosphaerae]RHA37050.1 YtxH domain-containing protein [Cellulomonas rhizosphaerae]